MGFTRSRILCISGPPLMMLMKIAIVLAITLTASALPSSVSSINAKAATDDSPDTVVPEETLVATTDDNADDDTCLAHEGGKGSKCSDHANFCVSYNHKWRASMFKCCKSTCAGCPADGKGDCDACLNHKWKGSNGQYTCATDGKKYCVDGGPYGYGENSQYAKDAKSCCKRTCMQSEEALVATTVDNADDDTCLAHEGWKGSKCSDHANFCVSYNHKWRASMFKCCKSTCAGCPADGKGDCDACLNHKWKGSNGQYTCATDGKKYCVDGGPYGYGENSQYAKDAKSCCKRTCT